MEVKNNINKNVSSLKEQFKMEPPANAWDLLNADLDKRQAAIYKKRGDRFKMLSIFLLLLLLISFITYYFTGSSSNQNGSANIAENKLPANEKRDIVQNSNVSPVQSQSSFEHNAPASQTQADKPVSKSITKNNVEVSQPEVKSGREKESPGRNTSKAIRETMPVATAGKTNGILIRSKIRNNVTSTKAKENDVLPQHDEKEIASIPDRPANASQVEYKREDGEKKTSAVAPEPWQESVTHLPLLVLPSLSENKNGADNETELALLKDETGKGKNSADSTTEKKQTILSRIFVEAVFSPDYSKNHLTNNSSNSEYASEYSKREKTNFAFHAGVIVGYDVCKHWSLSSGAIYSTIDYSITLPYIYGKAGANYKMQYKYPTSCGNITLPESNNAAIKYADSLNMPVGCNQVVRFINVPFTVRFRATRTLFTPYAYAGLSANFAIQERAVVQAGNTETTIVNNIDGLKKMNYGYLFGAGVQYFVHPDMAVFIEPSYRGSITSLTQNTLVNCYPYSFGLNAGLYLHF